MSNKNYNVFFNTHTVSGIVISVALYVIFFAGSIGLFSTEISSWQSNGKNKLSVEEKIDFDQTVRQLDEEYQLIGRDIEMNFGDSFQHKLYLRITANKDSTATEKTKKSYSFYYHPQTKQSSIDEENYHLGEFFVFLHYFRQIPFIGTYLAGFVSFFFLFAIVTGVIVHWKKIIPNFYYFNPKTSLKRVWADGHTVLGVLGLPFQLIYAITGSYLCIGILVLIPALVTYGGDQKKLMDTLRPSRKTYEWVEKSDLPVPSFNEFVKKSKDKWEDFELYRVAIHNYRGKNMKVTIMGDRANNLDGEGYVTFNAYSGEIESFTNPYDMPYVEYAQTLFGGLHFGDYGGLGLKAVYFILAFITCFVIITGVLIWVEARNKKSKTIKQRLYTTKIGHIYMAICISLLPVSALTFLFVKITDGIVFHQMETPINVFFFITWLLFIIYFRFKRDNYYTNKICLLLTAIFGFLVPIANGFISGNWFWLTAINQQHEILVVDLIWIIIAFFSLIFYLKITPAVQMQSSYSNISIDYKNAKELLEQEKAELLEST